MFLLYSTQQEAQEACDRVFNNIRNWLKEYYPIRVHPLGLISLNIDGTPNLAGQITTKWADPSECEEGWFIPKPEQKDVGQIPIAVALEGVGGIEATEVTPIENNNIIG